MQQDHGRKVGRERDARQASQHQQTACQQEVARAHEADQAPAIDAHQHAAQQERDQHQAQRFQRHLIAALHLRPGDAQGRRRYSYGDEAQKANGKQLAPVAWPVHTQRSAGGGRNARLEPGHLLHLGPIVRQ